MSNFQFNFNVDEFNSIFPFYILIDEELKIKCIGKSLAKLLPKEFIGSSFVDLFEFQRPHFDELNIQNINQTFNQLVIFNPKIDASISLRGQINSFHNNYLFVGTPWFSSIQDVVDKKLTLHDFAFHDPLLDLLHVLKNQEINNEELKELLQTLNNQRKLLKKDKEELNKLSVVASANNNGVVFTKPDGTIYWCNDAYVNLTGYSKEEIYGKTPVEIGRLPESSVEQIRKMVAAFGNNEPFDVEILHKTKSGKTFWSRTKGQPIKDANGTTIQYFAMVDDVTKEKIKEERLQILSSIADVNINAVIICDKDGKIEWVNNSFENITGYKLAEVIGKTPGSILQGEESNPDTVKYLRDQIKAGESFNCEILNYSKSKNKYWIRIQGQPLKDKNGELIKYFAIEEDISLEKKYYESIKTEKEKYSNIIANMNMGLLEVDNQDTILLANQSFCEMSGYTLLDLIGTKASDLLSNISDKKVIQTKNEMRSSGISDSYEVTAKTKDGQTKFWMISGAPNYNVNGEIVGSIGVHLDITQQKSLELQKEQLLVRLEKQNEQLNEYAQIVSHDLKSPLRSIHSLISWIKEDNIGEFSPQSVEYLKMIESKVEKMDHLIQGILTYSKMDTLDLSSEKIDVNDVVKNIINIIHIPDNIQVSIKNLLPTIIADKYRIQQLFQNLIGNAVTYIDKINGLVEVDFTEEEEHFIFSIKDNGPGIALENQEKIFKVFQSFTKNEKSTGIGLSIVKRIVDNYKGEIWIESQLTIGTTFFVKLPKKYN
ncbi:PAS domain S-box protein [Flavobacterium sp.]|jgi:PAS domain S-box-containing protein|uniref:PAS domain S-box protein n=1 Tax=Flavobacterium sp. TaxID=239 RepID=UPI0037C12650